MKNVPNTHAVGIYSKDPGLPEFCKKSNREQTKKGTGTFRF
ncbi:hypothetical protein CLU96_0343 [Chryseobacterium sp. 52]|nr:hypothetical protein [Chryseobacterium sp. 52]PIF43435.1 hypothetical protein CLU96_0343 [Chryseobacterium sp. 52]